MRGGKIALKTMQYHRIPSDTIIIQFAIHGATSILDGVFKGAFLTGRTSSARVKLPRKKQVRHLKYRESLLGTPLIPSLDSFHYCILYFFYFISLTIRTLANHDITIMPYIVIVFPFLDNKEVQKVATSLDDPSTDESYRRWLNFACL